MEHRERVTCDSITVKGVTIEVDVELSVYLLDARGSNRGRYGGVVRIEPVQIRLHSREETESIDLRE